MPQCAMCRKEIPPNGQYLTVTVHNGAKTKNFDLCGPDCFVAYGVKSGLMEIAGSGPTRRFG